VTVSEFCDIYLSEACSKKKPSTVALEHGHIDRHIRPLLGKVAIKTLNRADIERFMSNVAAGKTAVDIKTKARGRAIVKGGKGAANRSTELLASILNYAVDKNIRDDNPAQGIKKYKLKKHERLLSKDELTRLGEALIDAEAKGGNSAAIAAIRFLMLTGCRKSEALTLKWDWVDQDRNMLRLPDSKTGAKVVPLGAPAVDFLSTVPRNQENPFVFPSTKTDSHLVDIQKIWNRIRTAAGLEDLRLHDLRHNYASIGASQGESLYVVGKILGHTQAQTTQRYAHLAVSPVQSAADNISTTIADALTGERS